MSDFRKSRSPSPEPPPFRDVTNQQYPPRVPTTRPTPGELGVPGPTISNENIRPGGPRSGRLGPSNSGTPQSFPSGQGTSRQARSSTLATRGTNPTPMASRGPPAVPRSSNPAEEMSTAALAAYDDDLLELDYDEEHRDEESVQEVPAVTIPMPYSFRPWPGAPPYTEPNPDYRIPPHFSIYPVVGVVSPRHPLHEIFEHKTHELSYLCRRAAKSTGKGPLECLMVSFSVPTLSRSGPDVEHIPILGISIGTADMELRRWEPMVEPLKRWIPETFGQEVPFRIWERNYKVVRYADSTAEPAEKGRAKVFPPFNPLEYEDREDFECELVPGYGHTIGGNTKGAGSLGLSFRIQLPDGRFYPDVVRLTCHHVISNSYEAIPWNERQTPKNQVHAPAQNKLKVTIEKCVADISKIEDDLLLLAGMLSMYCEDSIDPMDPSLENLLPMYVVQKLRRMHTAEPSWRVELAGLRSKLKTLESFETDFGHVLFSSGNKIINTISPSLKKRALAIDYAFVAVKPTRQGEVRLPGPELWPEEISSDFDKIKAEGRLRSVNISTFRMPVVKSGAATRLTSGIVGRTWESKLMDLEQFDRETREKYKLLGDEEGAMTINFLATDPTDLLKRFSTYGDSGAPIFDKTGNCSGIVVAGMGHYVRKDPLDACDVSIMTPIHLIIKHAEREYNIKLIYDDGGPGPRSSFSPTSAREENIKLVPRSQQESRSEGTMTDRRRPSQPPTLPLRVGENPAPSLQPSTHRGQRALSVGSLFPPGHEQRGRSSLAATSGGPLSDEDWAGVVSGFEQLGGPGNSSGPWPGQSSSGDPSSGGPSPGGRSPKKRGKGKKNKDKDT